MFLCSSTYILHACMILYVLHWKCFPQGSSSNYFSSSANSHVHFTNSSMCPVPLLHLFPLPAKLHNFQYANDLPTLQADVFHTCWDCALLQCVQIWCHNLTKCPVTFLNRRSLSIQENKGRHPVFFFFS